MQLKRRGYPKVLWRARWGIKVASDKLSPEQFKELCLELGLMLPDYDVDRLYAALAKRLKWDENIAAREFIGVYCEEFKARYGAAPVVTGKTAGTAKRLVKEMGLARASELLRTYFTMNDSFFINSRHDLALFAMRINVIVVKHETGGTISQKELQDADRLQGERAGWDKLRRNDEK